MILGAREVAVGELQQGVQTRRNGLLRHGQAVVGDSNVPDFALSFRLQSRVVKAVLSAWLWTERRVMELVYVDVIGAQQPQAGLQMLVQFCPGFCVGLGGDNDPIPHPLKGIPHFFFAVGVGPGCIKVGHASIYRLAQQASGLLFGNPLNRQTAKTVLFNLNAGGTELDF